MNKFRLKVSEAGSAYYHAFNLWPEARPLSKNQQRTLNLFEFLIKHGGEVEPIDSESFEEVPNRGRSYGEYFGHIVHSYKKLYECDIHEVTAQIGITVGFFNFLVVSQMLILEKANNG